MKEEKRQKIRLLVARILAEALWLILTPILRFFLSLKVETEENLKNISGPLIIVANHKYWLDPFVIGTAFPFRSKIFPMSYGVWYKYYYKFYFFGFLWAMYCFPIIKNKNLNSSLKKASEILKQGGVVGIFPEGKRRHLGRPPRGRRGAAFLAIKNKVPLLPVYIDIKYGMTLKDFFFKKVKATIIIGKRFSLPVQPVEPPELLNRPADLIMEKINSLAKTKKMGEDRRLNKNKNHLKRLVPLKGR